MPKVLNKYKDIIPPNAKYIGRGSPYGNPFIIGKHGDRNMVCESYEASLKTNPVLVEKIKRELRGYDLVCFCKPQRCHGDILLRIANED